jgi:hypothetical protein
MRQKIANEGGAIVYFHTLRPEAKQTVADIQVSLPLAVLVQASDGTIYIADLP